MKNEDLIPIIVSIIAAIISVLGLYFAVKSYKFSKYSNIRHTNGWFSMIHSLGKVEKISVKELCNFRNMFRYTKYDDISLNIENIENMKFSSVPKLRNFFNSNFSDDFEKLQAFYSNTCVDKCNNWIDMLEKKESFESNDDEFKEYQYLLRFQLKYHECEINHKKGRNKDTFQLLKIVSIAMLDDTLKNQR
ncbi:hypothetical protein RD055328_08210 [Companilactobacillus sp. RD055328]|uniref:hypothetical protein n=1 Tax=Companilactobacillus sp. RD055328 TaxID=2916634 RepID=UPI001FC8C446|nr:hypothetical protein [Companilactobacillus sp. RD055328]GKQ42898.1 hypothetical protein RD055328_08210 [Companilactobacillus sp. RD055328]